MNQEEIQRAEADQVDQQIDTFKEENYGIQKHNS